MNQQLLLSILFSFLIISCATEQNDVLAPTVMADAEPPAISLCPDSIVLVMNQFGDFVLDNYASLIDVSDNVTATPDLLYSQDPIAGFVADSSSASSLTITVTDEAMNSSSCVIPLIYLLDVTPPTITSCHPDTVLHANFGCEYVLPDYTTQITVMDDVSDPGDIVITQSIDASTTISPSTGVLLLCLIATDQVGNSTSCCFDISLVDITAPSITCPSDTSVSAGPAPDFTSLVLFDDNCSSSGNCVISQSPAPGDVLSAGLFTFTIAVADENGNTSTCEFLVEAQ